MLAFLLQARAFVTTGAVYPFAVFMAWIWLLWALKVVLGSRYRPATERFGGTASVIVPVVDEPLDLFRDVLLRVAQQHPHEVIVVVNGPRNEGLERVCDEVGVTWAWTETPGKRGALAVGLRQATGEIAVLVDSDTVWTDGTLEELLKPFNDPTVGGVTTRQRILRPERNVLTRWADWLESVRSEYSMPAMSVLGTVGCLPGRTIAFRRQVLLDHLDQFLGERFLGVFLEVSDDRTLTNYTLKAGYRTVYQSTSLVLTDAPTGLRKLVRQQFRWARGSQYNTARMLPWMVRHAPVLALFYLSDVITPFLLLGASMSWLHALASGSGLGLYDGLPFAPGLATLTGVGVLALAMSALSLALRFSRHFAFQPKDLLYLPVFMLINTLLLMPVRVVGLFAMAHNAGWGTRSGGFAGERRRNPQAALPYLLGGVLVCASVVWGV